MKDAIRQPNRYVSGEAWVLGPIAQQLDKTALEQRLSDRYAQDYLGEWRNVVRKAQVLSYANLMDADAKLSSDQPYVAPPGVLLVCLPKHPRGNAGGQGRFSALRGCRSTRSTR